MSKISKFDLARIIARIDKTESGCWVWTGNKQLQIWLNHTEAPARVPRLLYDYYNEESCDRYQLGFKCGNSLCVNPAHAFLAGKRTKPEKKRRLYKDHLADIDMDCVQYAPKH